MKISTPIRYSIHINGLVQGVGFRPFIYNLALEYGLSGFVSNTAEGVDIEIEGDEESISQFLIDIPLKAPSISEITDISKKEIPFSNTFGFNIIQSGQNNSNQTLISPDISICDDCLKELFDPENKRYLYPFINCTNCGPRFTIIEDIPYDRPFTVMKDFEMCGQCKEEYERPTDRRFHAQPNACEICGPKLWIADDNDIIGNSVSNVIEHLADILLNGKIAAIKGLGGFHLAADAWNNDAVSRLRQKKNREAKPLAVMVENIEDAEKLVRINEETRKLLTSPQRPIVLLERNDKQTIAESVAPGNNRLGIMLPYTPVHYILFHFLRRKFNKERFPALIMTSGNLSDEPIAIDNNDSRKRLSNIADEFLLHNRDILIRSDDSVVTVFNNKQRIFRRSRGYVPKPVFVNSTGHPLIALGGELKNSICLLKGNKGFLSQHIGDLTNLSAYEFFQETIVHMQNIMDTKAEYLVHDMHPEYLSTKFAKEQNSIPLIEVQHHHAHMASCMAENNIDDDVIGLILDGTGFGYDNSIWGGEIILGNYTQIRRFAHLEYMPLPGGDAAAKEPWRTAVSYIYNAFNKKVPMLDGYDNDKTRLIYEMLDKGINTPFTSSTGRLFDAVSAMCGGPKKNRYEAEAAISLMQAASGSESMTFDFGYISNNNNGTNIIPLKKLIRSVINAVSENLPYSKVASIFHKTLARMFVEEIILAYEDSKIHKVVLSGGVFQNEILSTLIENELTNIGFEVFIQSAIPANDGGLSLGQAVIARNLLNKKMTKAEYII